MRSCGDGTTVASGRSRIHMAFTLSAWHPVRCILQPSPVHCNTYIRMYIHLAALYVLTTTVTPLHWTPIFICVCVCEIFLCRVSGGYQNTIYYRPYTTTLLCYNNNMSFVCECTDVHPRSVLRSGFRYQNIIHRRTWIIFENYEYLKQKQCPMKCISIDNSGFF